MHIDSHLVTSVSGNQVVVSLRGHLKSYIKTLKSYIRSYWKENFLAFARNFQVNGWWLVLLHKALKLRIL